MRTKLKIIAITLAHILFISCATATSNMKAEDVLRMALQGLPAPEEVGAVGKRAVQKTLIWQAYNGAKNETLLEVATLPTDAVTQVVVSKISSYPPEIIISAPFALESYLYSLAHQWGITQLSIGYLKAYEQLLDKQEKRYAKQRKRLRLANIFNALGNAGYHFSNAANAFSGVNDPFGRLNNELAAATGQAAIQRNEDLMLLMDEKLDSIEAQKLQLEETKISLLSYSKLLKTYRDWIIAAVAEKEKSVRGFIVSLSIPAEINKILQAEAAWELAGK